tara:strand:- start:26 stop:505 length:480 start_codon:yes stop_codon:yes gene_type:complete
MTSRKIQIPRKIPPLDIFDEDEKEDETPDQTGSPRKIQHLDIFSDDSDNSDDESQKVYQHQNRAITEIHSANPVCSRRRPAYAPPATTHEIDNIIFIVPSNKDWSEAATKAFTIPKNGIRIFRNVATKWFEHYIKRHKFTAKLKQKDSNVLTYECTGCI